MSAGRVIGAITVAAVLVVGAARADERLDCEQVRAFIANAGGIAEAERLAGRYGIPAAYIERAKRCLKQNETLRR